MNESLSLSKALLHIDLPLSCTTCHIHEYVTVRPFRKCRDGKFPRSAGLRHPVCSLSALGVDYIVVVRTAEHPVINDGKNEALKSPEKHTREGGREGGRKGFNR